MVASNLRYIYFIVTLINLSKSDSILLWCVRGIIEAHLIRSETVEFGCSLLNVIFMVMVVG